MAPPPERPAFTVSAAAVRPSLPVEAWAAGMLGVGAVFASALQSPGCFDWCSPALLYPSLLVLSCVLASLTWFLLPLNSGLRATLRAAGSLSIAAGAAAAIPLTSPHLQIFGDLRALPLLVAGGLAAPALMLPAVSPGASLEVAGRPSKGPVQWLRMGALPALLFFAGFGVAFAIPSAVMLGPAGLVVGGALTLRSAARAPPLERGPRSLQAGRVGRLFRMTPMLRLHALGEIAVAFAFASCATVALTFSSLRFDSSLVSACVLGGAAGAVVYGVLAPTLDAAWGRGRLLTLVLFCAAVAPLLLLAGPFGPTALGLFAAGMLLGFALAASPQRSALAFDLSSSQGRLRLSGDLQGAKLLAAAAAPAAFSMSERVSAGLGPLAAALVGIVAFALFAPSLGSLGVPRR